MNNNIFTNSCSIGVVGHTFVYEHPLVDMFLLHIPEVFVSKIAVSFSNSWYDVTDGLASAEQLKLMT